jgi:hypothetical protein
MQQRAARGYAWRRPLTESDGGGSLTGALPDVRSRWARTGLLALTLAVLASLVLAHLVGGNTSQSTPARPLPPAARGLEALPIAARGPISRLLGASTAGYAIQGLRAGNPAQRFGLSFTRSGASIDPGRSKLGVSLAAYGSSDSLRSLAPARPQVSHNTVSYAYGPLREWFANGPAGLEQGFDLTSAPHGGAGSLTFLLRTSGDFSARKSGAAILLSGGGKRLRYGDLVATDARGHRLPADLSLRHGDIAIHVDARGAAYPLHIDPLVEQVVLRQPGETPDGGFGEAVAISGKTIAVGDDYTEDLTGEVYVYEEPAGGWGEVQKPVATLRAGDSQKESFFGDAVALSGNKLVVGALGQRDEAAANEYAGAAYVFEAPSTSKWSEAKQIAKLESKTGYSQLGVSVAISGKTIVAGASGLGTNLGALFVFEEPAGGWGKTSQYAAKLHGPNLAEIKFGEECPQLGDATSVAEHDSVITVIGGAPGVYDPGYNDCTKQVAGGVDVFTANVGEWNKGSEYAPTVTLAAPTSEAGNDFGQEVGLSEDGSTVLAGAPDESVSGVKDAGAAYVFTRPAGGWATAPAPATLTSPDRFEEADFGYGVALAASGAKVVVDQPSLNPSARQNGHEFVFERPVGGWANTSGASEELTADAEEGLNLDGHELALEGETLVTDANAAVIVFGSSLGVEILSPVNGATYAPGQSVTASYRCVPPPGGAITECNGPVAPGAAIDTSSEGIHSFTVNGKDSAGQSFSRTSVYLVTGSTTSTKSGTEPVSKEGAQQTKTKAQIEAEEAAHQAQVKLELKEFAVYVLYILEHPAPLGLCFNENGFQENGSVVPVSAWISAHGTTAPRGASSAGAASIASAGKGHKPKKPKEVTVFTKTLEVKPGKVSFKVPFTKAGRVLAKRDIASHRSLKVKWTVTIRPVGMPSVTKTFTVTLKPGKTTKRTVHKRR